MCDSHDCSTKKLELAIIKMKLADRSFTQGKPEKSTSYRTTSDIFRIPVTLFFSMAYVYFMSDKRDGEIYFNLTDKKCEEENRGYAMPRTQLNIYDQGIEVTTVKTFKNLGKSFHDNVGADNVMNSRMKLLIEVGGNN